MPNYEMSLEFLDGDGKRARRSYYTAAPDRATALARLQGLAEAANDIVRGAVVGATITEDVSIAGWDVRAVPLSGADVEVQGVFIGRVVGNYPYKTSVPTFDKDAFTVTGGAIDLGLPEVSGFAQNALVLGNFADYRYTDIIAIDKGKEAFG